MLKNFIYCMGYLSIDISSYASKTRKIFVRVRLWMNRWNRNNICGGGLSYMMKPKYWCYPYIMICQSYRRWCLDVDRKLPIYKSRDRTICERTLTYKRYSASSSTDCVSNFCGICYIMIYAYVDICYPISRMKYQSK